MCDVFTACCAAPKVASLKHVHISQSALQKYVKLAKRLKLTFGLKQTAASCVSVLFYGLISPPNTDFDTKKHHLIFSFASNHNYSSH